IRTDAGCAHAEHFGVRDRFLVHGAVGDVEPVQDELLFLAMAQGSQLAVKILHQAGGGDGGSHTAALDPAHTVAHDPPAGAVRQLPGTEIVLVFLPAASDVGLTCDLHGSFLSFSSRAAAASSRRSCPQAALISA